MTTKFILFFTFLFMIYFMETQSQNLKILPNLLEIACIFIEFMYLYFDSRSNWKRLIEDIIYN